jgi:hypothetical protein
VPPYAGEYDAKTAIYTDWRMNSSLQLKIPANLLTSPTKCGILMVVKPREVERQRQGGTRSLESLPAKESLERLKNQTRKEATDRKKKRNQTEQAE